MSMSIYVTFVFRRYVSKNQLSGFPGPVQWVSKANIFLNK